MLRSILRIPTTLAVVALSGTLAAGCNGTSAVDAGSDGEDISDAADAPMADGLDAADCNYTCMTEYFPGPDGAIVQVVLYADGFESYDATCQAPPPDPRCGV